MIKVQLTCFGNQKLKNRINISTYKHIVAYNTTQIQLETKKTKKLQN